MSSLNEVGDVIQLADRHRSTVALEKEFERAPEH